MKNTKKSLRLLVLLIATLVIGVGLTACSQKSNSRQKSTSNSKTTSQAVSKSTGKNANKTLLVYYSLTDNTATLAKKIHTQSGIDIVRIDAKNAYPTDDNDAINARVERENNANQYDSLTNVPSDLSKYDTIIVGFPIWSNDVAYPIQSFLGQNAKALANKRIVPFSTSAMADSAAINQTEQTIKRLVPNAQLQAGLNLTSGDTSTNRISKWLNKTVLVNTDSTATAKNKTQRTNINVKVGNRTFAGYLNGTVAATALARRLPQTLTFKTFASGYPEKYAELGYQLSTKGMSGDDPKSGDIDYNSNNHSLFFYYGQVGEFAELHNIGHITANDYAEFIKQQNDDFEVTISLAK